MTVASGPRRARWPLGAADFLGMGIAFSGLVLFFAMTTDHFFTATNFRTLANQVPPALIVAVGMTFVLMTGGIDLSVGSVMALCGAVLGIGLVHESVPAGAAFLACLGTGLGCGFVVGAIVARFRIPSFIATLGMLEAARGGAYFTTGSETQYLGSRVEWVVEPVFAGITLSFFLAVAVVALGQLVLAGTVFGRHVAATGYNEEVARLAGIRTRAVRLAVFTLCGGLTAVAALIHTARLTVADPNTGQGFELEAIAAVVIGGTSLSGGRGSVARSTFGVIIIAVLGSGLAHAGAQESTKRLITGLVIVTAVVLDRYRRREG